MAKWLDAVSRFLEEEFSPAELQQGVPLYRDGYIKNISQAGNLYIAELKEAPVEFINFRLEQDQPEPRCIAQVEGEGSEAVWPECRPELACWVYAAALALHGMLETGRPVPENRRFSRKLDQQQEEFQAWLRKIARKHPGKALTTSQKEYAKRVWTVYREIRSRGKLSARLLARVDEQLKPRRGADLDYWADPPQQLELFWNYLALALKEAGAEIPQFLEPVTDLAQARARVAEHQHQRHLEDWRNYIRRTEQEILVQDPYGLEMRLRIDGREACWQLRYAGQSHFHDLRREEFVHLHEKEKLNRLQLSSATAALWQHLKYHWQQCNALRIYLTTPEGARCLNHLLLHTETRLQIVCSRGDPLVWSEIPLCWRCREVPEAPHYILELVNERGFTAAEDVLCLPGPKDLYLWGRTVYPGPRLLEMPQRNRMRVLIPRTVLENPQGLSFLHSLGVETPENLQDKVEERQFRIEITATLQKSTRRLRPGAECIVFDVQAREPRSGQLERLGAESWTVLEEGALQRRHKLVWINSQNKQEAVSALLRLGASAAGRQSGAWVLEMKPETPQALVEWIEELPPAFEVRLRGELATLREPPLKLGVQIKARERGMDWLDLKMTVEHQDLGDLPDEEVTRLLKARGDFVRVPGKGWQRVELSVTDEQKADLLAAGFDPATSQSKTRRVHVLSLQELDDSLLSAEDRQKVLERRRAFKPITPLPLPESVNAALRDYQKQGFDFLCYLTLNGFGGILADDMGLGKTLQTLCWLLWLRNHLRQSAQDDPEFTALIVCPKTVMDGWVQEAAKHAPGFKVCRHGPKTTLCCSPLKCQLYIANYAQLRRDAAGFEERTWSAVILDEAQYIKNPQSITARVARRLKTDHRLVLTGTPIENRLLDLWSLMQFAMPGVLGSQSHFRKFYDSIDTPGIRERVAHRVKPFMLRRTKDEVAQDLPAKLEKGLSCVLEGRQKQLYQAELRDARRALQEISATGDFEAQRQNILRSLTRLRQICCHPGLIHPAGENWASAKLEMLEDHLDPLVQEGHRVLVFSQWVSMLDIVSRRLQERGHPFLYLSGRSDNREEIIRKFREAEGSMIFLLSLRAAGAGLNLSEARYVFLFDPWWNPAVEAQAVDRAHRIGTLHNVITYRLFAKNTIEEKMLHLKKRKHQLAQDIFTSGGATDFRKLTLENLLELLE